MLPKLPNGLRLLQELPGFQSIYTFDVQDHIGVIVIVISCPAKEGSMGIILSSNCARNLRLRIAAYSEGLQLVKGCPILAKDSSTTLDNLSLR